MNTTFSGIKKHPFLFLIITVLSLLECVVHIYAFAATWGKLTFAQYLPVVLTLALCFSLIKYAIDYFSKQKDVSLNIILLRYSAALIGNILVISKIDSISLVLFCLTLLLAPFLAGSIKDANIVKNSILVSVIMLLTIAISVRNIVDSVLPDVYQLGRAIYIFSACNVAILWLMIALLFFDRMKVEINKKRVTETAQSI